MFTLACGLQRATRRGFRVCTLTLQWHRRTCGTMRRRYFRRRRNRHSNTFLHFARGYGSCLPRGVAFFTSMSPLFGKPWRALPLYTFTPVCVCVFKWVCCLSVRCSSGLWITRCLSGRAFHSSPTSSRAYISSINPVLGGLLWSLCVLWAMVIICPLCSRCFMRLVCSSHPPRSVLPLPPSPALTRTLSQSLALPLPLSGVRHPCPPHGSLSVPTFSYFSTILPFTQLPTTRPELPVISPALLKWQFTQNWNFTHLLLTAGSMEAAVKFSNPHHRSEVSQSERITPSSHVMKVYSGIVLRRKTKKRNRQKNKHASVLLL